VGGVVAIEVTLTDGGKRYFLTWGRIQDPVDPAPVCNLVLRFAASCSLGGTPATARLCATMRDAADSPDAPYFYECFAAISSRRMPLGDDYRIWQAERAAEMQAGHEIWYCGRSA
jgi:hypothetical protein